MRTEIDTTTSLDVIEALDWDHELSCDRRLSPSAEAHCDEPAAYLVVHGCCGKDDLRCLTCYARVTATWAQGYALTHYTSVGGCGHATSSYASVTPIRGAA